MDFRQKLGKFIRERYGDNYAGLEDASGVSAIKKIVNGTRRNPQLGTLAKIAEVLHVSLHELFDDFTVVLFVREMLEEPDMPENVCLESLSKRVFRKYTVDELINGYQD